MTGAFMPFLIDEFRLRVRRVDRPGSSWPFRGGPLVVNTSREGWRRSERTYSANINIPAGTVRPAFTLVTLVQLHDDGGPGNPYPIVATVEGPIVTIFQPA
jgi:hypothetical protein